MKTKILVIVIGLALLSLVGFRVRNALRPKAAPNAAAHAVIVTARVAHADLPLTVSMTGTVRARNDVEVFPKVSGRVQSVHAQVGERVTAGQLLAVIEHQEIAWQAKAAEAAVAVARANRDGAKLDFDRTKALYEGGAAAAAQLDGAKVKLDLTQAQVAQAEAAAGLAQQQLQNARIESPITGTIIRRPVNVGAQVSPTTSLFSVQDVTSLKLESSVDAASFARLHKGQSAEIAIDSLTGSYAGKVSLLSPALDAQSRRAAVEIEIDNSKGLLLPNMFAHVSVAVATIEQALVIPREAVLESAGGAIVYKVDGEHVRSVTPKLGAGDEHLVVVESGLADGDVLAVSGLSGLADGVAVTVAPSTSGPLGQNL